MIVLVDIDGVVAEMQAAWLGLYNHAYDDNLTLDHITDWSVHRFVKPECGPKVYDFLRCGYLYDLTSPVDGAVLGLSRIRSMGHTVRFVSAGFYNGKVRWLHEHGLLVDYPHGKASWEATRDVIITADKAMVRGDVLVDDRYDNVAEFPGHGILYDRPWNRAHPWASRASNWEEVVEKIRRMGDGV